jgi:hypothetical protein
MFLELRDNSVANTARPNRTDKLFDTLLYFWQSFKMISLLLMPVPSLNYTMLLLRVQLVMLLLLY